MINIYATHKISQIITTAKATLLGAAIARTIDLGVSAGTSADLFGLYGYGAITTESSSSTSSLMTSSEVQNNITSSILTSLVIGKDANIYGTQLVSGGDINITADNLNITASKDAVTSSSSSSYDSVTVQGKTTGTYGGSFTHGESESSLTSTDYVGSSLVGDNVSIVVNKDVNVLGSNIVGDTSVLINTGNDLNVKTLQNTLSSESSSYSYTFGTDIGFSISASSRDKTWGEEQAGVVSNNNLDIITGNNTNLEGSLINSKMNDMNLSTGSLTYGDLKQTDSSFSYAYSLMGSSSLNRTGSDVKIGQNSTNNNQDISGQTGVYNTGSGSSTVDVSNSGFDKEGVARATVGGGVIVIGGEDSGQSMVDDGLNRDVSKSMVVTRDEVTGGLDVDQVTVDHGILTSEYWESVGRGSPVTIAENIKNNIGHLPGILPGIFYPSLEPKTGKDIGEHQVMLSSGKYLDENGEIIDSNTFKPGYYEEMEAGTFKYISPEKPAGLFFNGSINQYETNPALQSLWYFVPIVMPFTQNHDYAVGNKIIPSNEKASSIPEYLTKTLWATAGTSYILAKESVSNLFRNENNSNSNNKNAQEK